MSFLLSAKGCIPIDGGGAVEMERVLAGMHTLFSETWPFKNAQRRDNELSFKVFAGGLFVPAQCPLAMVTSGAVRLAQEGGCLKIDYEFSFKGLFMMVCVIVGGIASLGIGGALFGTKSGLSFGAVVGLILVLPIVFMFFFGLNKLLAAWRLRRFLEKIAQKMVAALHAGQPITMPKDPWHSGWW